MRYFATPSEVRKFVLCHDASTISAIGGLVNSGAATYGAVEQGDIQRNAESQRNAQYNKLAALSDPKTLLKNIMAIKQSLTSQQKDMITQSVAARLVQQGQGGATGLIQEAVDQALQQADNQLFQEAAATYLQSVGLPIQALRGQTAVGGSSPIGAASGAFSALAKLLNQPKGLAPIPTGASVSDQLKPTQSDPNATDWNTASMPPLETDTTMPESGD